MNLVIDATNLVTRAFFTDPNEDKTWAIFKSCNMLLDTIQVRNPTTMHFCFDAPDGNSWRKEIFPDYKANRPPKPEHLQYQVDLMRTTMVRVGLSVYQYQAAEADDLIATLVWQLDGKKVLLSSDKDLMQLLDYNTYYLRYTKQFKYAENITYATFEDKFGFQPAYFADYQALVGDTSDNIPGARGIGPVTAKQLIGKYKTIGNMLASDENDDLIKVKKSRENVRMSYELTKLRKIVPLEVKSGEFSLDAIHQIAEITRG